MSDVFSRTLGASNHTNHERAEYDYYATEPKAVEKLLELETFAPVIWEPACGQGHIAEVLKEKGYKVLCSDLIDRGYGTGGIDFLKADIYEVFDGDIVTNPPYNVALDFIKKALDVVKPGKKVAMLLKIQFLEGKKRKDFFSKFPPRTIYVSRSRIRCAPNGDFDNFRNGSTICYAWYVWEKGFTGDPVIKWFN